jgi:hypothetical protein
MGGPDKMFILFHEKRKWNKKGQLAPVFLLVIVVLIIMTMITINLGKIALTKTDAVNSVDAGSLAGASGMANLFNNIAVANSQLEVAYQEFFADTSVMFTIALSTLIMAQTQAAAAMTSGGAAEAAAGVAESAALKAAAAALILPCKAEVSINTAITSLSGAMGFLKATYASLGSSITSLGSTIATIHAMNVSIISFAISQQFFYMSIRKMAEEGHKNSIRIAHQFLFRNSGVNAKLKSGKKELPEDLSSGLKNVHLCNYQETFNAFLKYIVKDNAIYPYAWQDGQDRLHTVTSMVNIDKVNKFSLKNTL